MSSKTIIGLKERVVVKGPRGRKKEVMAKIDTGADKSSMDVKLAAELRLGPIVKSTLVKSAAGAELRPVVKAKIVLDSKEIESEFTLAERSHMKHKVLIGQNMLQNNGFLIDPDKNPEHKISDFAKKKT